MVALARPSPLLAPVTQATFPASENSGSLGAWVTQSSLSALRSKFSPGKYLASRTSAARA